MTKERNDQRNTWEDSHLDGVARRRRGHILELHLLLGHFVHGHFVTLHAGQTAAAVKLVGLVHLQGLVLLHRRGRGRADHLHPVSDLNSGYCHSSNAIMHWLFIHPCACLEQIQNYMGICWEASCVCTFTISLESVQSRYRNSAADMYCVRPGEVGLAWVTVGTGVGDGVSTGA